MAGLYLHIPFCKQKCSYCDFHFSTSLNHKTDLINALIKEIEQRKNQLTSEINTIYFGGGTPSLLSIDEFKLIVEAIQKNYGLSNKIEFTIETNPDDLAPQKLIELKEIGVNRLSIGIQSFFDDDLQFFNRAHNSKQAQDSILLSQDLGIENITIDLIYNSPTLTIDKWEQNLEKVKQLNIPHLSAYTLTIEENTALNHQVKTKLVKMPSDEEAIQQFKMLIDRTKNMGMVQYEVSNFGKEGYYSKHNSNYWKGEKYLGFGPSAHSFIGDKRSWNIANNMKYIQAINNGEPFFEEEFIYEKTAYNEYVLTRLRTVWGIDMNDLKTNFSEEIYNHFTIELEKYSKTSYLQTANNKITLTKEGIFIADKIASDFFIVE